MTDLVIPAGDRTDPAASPVTEQTTRETTPQAEKPAGSPQADAPAGEAKTTEETASGEDQSQDETEAKKTWKEKRQERNRERWREYKEAREFSGRRLAELEARLDRLTKQPDFSQITDPTEELAERTAWKIEQRNEATYKAEAEAERQRAHAAMSKAWAETTAEMRERVPDFDSVVTDKTPIHARAAPMIVESELGGEIAYWLGKNPAEAQRLYEMFETQPMRAVKELGRIEGIVSRPAPKTTSTAPKPAPVLSGGANPVQFDMVRSSLDDTAKELRRLGFIR